MTAFVSTNSRATAIGRVTPDGRGGVLATWYYWDGNQTTTRLAQVAGATRVDRSMPAAAGDFASVALVADGTVHFADGSQTTAVDLATWTTRWTRPTGAPVLALDDRSVLLHDAATQSLVRVDADGTVVESTPTSVFLVDPTVLLNGQGSLYGVDGTTGQIVELATAVYVEAAEQWKDSDKVFTDKVSKCTPYKLNADAPPPLQIGLAARTSPYTYQFEGAPLPWLDHQKAGVRDAFAAWDAVNQLAVPGIRFREFDPTRDEGTPSIVLRKTLIFANRKVAGGYIGGAQLPDRHTTGGEITFSEARLSSRKGYFKVALHEIGHSLGLAHPWGPGEMPPAFKINK